MYLNLGKNLCYSFIYFDLNSNRKVYTMDRKTKTKANSGLADSLSRKFKIVEGEADWQLFWSDPFTRKRNKFRPPHYKLRINEGQNNSPEKQIAECEVDGT